MITLDHHVLARIEDADSQPKYLAVDAPVLDASQFQTYRVRFLLQNAGTIPITAVPQLEYRPTGTAAYLVMPEKPELDVALYVDREWVPSLGLGGGTMQGPLSETIAVADLLIPNPTGGQAVAGRHSMGPNPDLPITLPPDSFTEQEFTVHLSIDAAYLTSYELRITDKGTPLTGTHVAGIRLGAAPAVQLSPGQRDGVSVGGPTSTSGTGATYPLVSAEPTVTDPAAATVAPAVTDPAPAVAYALDSGSLSPATTDVSSPAETAPTSLAAVASAPSEIHGPYSMTADQCSTCHRGHAAQSSNLLKSVSQSTLCFSCHNSSGAKGNVQAQYALTRPVNNPTEREYYSHDAVTPTTPGTHTRSELDEFGGLSNRHSECADCHNSHKVAKDTNSIQTMTGWTASGRLKGLSGVSVVNGAAGTAPAYTFLSGATDVVNEGEPVTNLSPIDREYQLCFKCHSGATTLLPNNPKKPSLDALDKAVEFNPNNASFHPIEAAGKNDTQAMKDSLEGKSPYKMWNFLPTSTIRCLNCHASSETPGPTPEAPTTPQAAANGSLPSHTSKNRGILLRPYTDRVLKSATAAYSAKDFALCYVCHAEAPFAPDSSSGATNFGLHSKHVTEIKGDGSPGANIDTGGAGQGNALCAECHFRIHSTTNKVGEPGGSRLVSFAPNVQRNDGPTASWKSGTQAGGPSCNLTCHGEPHDDYDYDD